MKLSMHLWPVFHGYEDMKQDIKKAGIGLWIYTGLQIVLGFVAGIGMFLLPNTVEVSFFFVSVFSAAGAILYLKNKYQNITWNMQSKFCLKEILQGFVLMMLVSFIWAIVSVFLNFILYRLNLPALSQDISLGNQWIGNLFLFLSVVIVAPIAEELVFRGLIFKRLSQYHVGFAMVISSLCFAMMHMNVVQGVPTFFMGLILSYFYWKTGSLKTSIGIHLLNNLFAMISMVWNIGFMTLLFAVLGIVFIAKEGSEIIQFVKEEKIPRFYFSYFFKSPVIICFIVFFVIMAAMSLV